MVRGGVTIDLGAPRQRALLALLVVHANAVVSVDRIVDELWGDAPAARAEHAVQVYVSALRKILGPVIVTRRPGYLLDIAPDDCDAYRFERLVQAGQAAMAAGDPATARATLSEALALWHGPVLADVADFVFATAAATRLDELHIAAIEDRIDADLALGSPLPPIAEIEALLGVHPLRERLWGQLMNALYRAGRQVDALRAYERFRRTLGEELGLEPSPELRRLEAAIVRHDPELASAPALPGPPIAATPPLPAPLRALAVTGPFIGRTDELDELGRAWNSINPDAVRLCLVTGEAGIGKSRLIAELAQRVHAAGAQVLYGACFEDLDVPYSPFVQALLTDLDGLGEHEAQRRLGRDAYHLDAILPGMGERTQGRAPTPSANPDVDRMRLFGAVSGYLARAAVIAPVLVVVEDLHWGTVSIRDLLRHIVRSGHGPVLVLATCRDVAPDITDDLTAFLADLQRHPNTQRISLTGLSRPDVADLVRASTADTIANPDRLAFTLHDVTDGSPLFVQELLRCGPPEDLLRPPLPLSPTLRDVVTARFAQLGSEDEPLVDAAAVLGADFEAGVLAMVVDRPVDEVLDGIERIERLGLVVGVPSRPGRFAFTHALLREVRYAQISASRRLRLHQRAGHVLADRAADGAHGADLARHFGMAATIGEADRAVHYARQAGKVARSEFAFADAADLFERAEAAARLASPPDAGLLCDLAIQRGEALHRGSDPRHRHVLLEAASAARRLGDQDRLAQAALALNEQGWTVAAGQLDDEVYAVARAALDSLGPEPSTTRSRLQAMLAAAMILTAFHEEGRKLSAEAVTAARQLDEPATLAEVLITAHWACFDPENLEERLGIADEVEALSRSLDDPVLKLQALLLRGSDLREAGEVRAGNQATRQAAKLADELGLTLFQVYAHPDWTAEIEGRLEDAERHVSQVLAIAGERDVDATAWVYPVMFSILLDRGRWEELAEALPGLLSGDHALPAYRASLAMMLARCGRHDEARGELEAFTETDFALMPRDVQWAAGMVTLADAVTHLDDAETARRLRPLLVPLSGRTLWQASVCLWPIDLALGQLAVVVGDHESARRHLGAAEATCVRCKTPIHLARCKVHQAWALSRAGGSGADPEIRSLLDDA
ncbi:MAG: BTAD domain-containing putative transcriptional regulator, partial [Acidimicrobiales bacterium]